MLASFLNMLDHPNRAAEMGMGGQGYVADFSHPDFVNEALILFGLIGNTCWD